MKITPPSEEKKRKQIENKTKRRHKIIKSEKN